MEHLKMHVYAWAEFFEADEETVNGLPNFSLTPRRFPIKDAFIKNLNCILYQKDRILRKERIRSFVYANNEPKSALRETLRLS